MQGRTAELQSTGWKNDTSPRTKVLGLVRLADDPGGNLARSIHRSVWHSIHETSFRSLTAAIDAAIGLLRSCFQPAKGRRRASDEG